MSTITRPPTARTAARFILVEERDPTIPLDRDGCPHVTGKLWLIPTASITAVEVTPEYDRGIVVKIHVRGLKTPVVPCDPAAFLAALGARVAAIPEGPLVWAEPDEPGEEAVGAISCAHCGEPLDATSTWCGPAGEERWLHQRCEAPALAEQQRQVTDLLARWQQQAEEGAAP